MIFRIDLKVFIFLILFYFTRQIEQYCIILFFATIHEMAHLFIGLLLKIKVDKVTFMPIGLSIKFKFEDEKDYKKTNTLEIKKMIIAIAGPLTNIAIIFFIQLLKMQKNTDIIIYANMLIAVFNLLPIYPLDGGRILKSILTILLNKYKANIYINYITNFTLFIVSFIFSIWLYYLKNISIIIIIIYLWYLVLKQNREYKVKKRMYYLLQSSKSTNYSRHSNK